ncbi:MAG: FAD-binding oxidoreductase [Archangium sp.]
MSPSIGSWARNGDGGRFAEPHDERELQEVLHVLTDRGAKLNVDLTLSRARLDAIGDVHQGSMSVEVGAGVILRDLDARLTPHGLSLGPLTPAAMALSLAEFLEGPYAGLRSIPGGRLEPVTASLRALAGDGRKLETSPAPRSAAGPDLNALVLGGHGRIALVTRAVVRCVPYPERDVRVACFSFDDATTFVNAMQRALAEGFWPWRVHVEPEAGRLRAEIRWAASVGSVERDRDLLARCVLGVGGRAESELEHETPVTVERETTWNAVRASLEKGHRLQLFRLSLTSVVARGEVEGLRLDAPSPWNPLSARLLSLDTRGVLGGAVR